MANTLPTVKTIYIQPFPNISRITGHEYGYRIYHTQIKPHISQKRQVIAIVFPKCIEGVSLSFISGLSSGLTTIYGDIVTKYVTLKSEYSSRLTAKLNNDLKQLDV